jgi:pimeloyl-ACP methyl ester carboxylesterase
MDDILRAFVPEDVDEQIGQIAAPTLIIWGERDRICHVSASERWKQLNDRFQIEVLSGVGHGLVLQRVGQVHKLLSGHLSRADDDANDP